MVVIDLATVRVHLAVLEEELEQGEQIVATLKDIQNVEVLLLAELGLSNLNGLEVIDIADLS